MIAFAHFFVVCTSRWRSLIRFARWLNIFVSPPIETTDCRAWN